MDATRNWPVVASSQHPSVLTMITVGSSTLHGFEKESLITGVGWNPSRPRRKHFMAGPTAPNLHFDPTPCRCLPWARTYWDMEILAMCQYDFCDTSLLGCMTNRTMNHGHNRRHSLNFRENIAREENAPVVLRNHVRLSSSLHLSIDSLLLAFFKDTNTLSSSYNASFQEGSTYRFRPSTHYGLH
jgi:hypothetical protein